jgi:hypothetical protein
MNGDKIILPDFLIADLYKDSLVDIENFYDPQQALAGSLPEETAIENGVAGKIKFSGENRKDITVVVDGAGSANVPKEDLAFLSNILKACQLNTSDIAIVSTGQQEVTYKEIKEQLNAHHILLFDVEPSVIGLPFKIPHFQVQHYDGCAIMPAPALKTLNKNTPEGKLLKTKLWNSLKLFFNIS